MLCVHSLKILTYIPSWCILTFSHNFYIILYKVWQTTIMTKWACNTMKDLLPLFVGSRDNEVTWVVAAQLPSLVTQHLNIVVLAEELLALLLHLVYHWIDQGCVILNLGVLVYKPWYIQVHVAFLHCLNCSRGCRYSWLAPKQFCEMRIIGISDQTQLITGTVLSPQVLSTH